jgi:hypothetical protein
MMMERAQASFSKFDKGRNSVWEEALRGPPLFLFFFPSRPFRFALFLSSSRPRHRTLPTASTKLKPSQMQSAKHERLI